MPRATTPNMLKATTPVVTRVVGGWCTNFSKRKGMLNDHLVINYGVLMCDVTFQDSISTSFEPRYNCTCNYSFVPHKPLCKHRFLMFQKNRSVSSTLLFNLMNGEARCLSLPTYFCIEPFKLSFPINQITGTTLSN